jgi:chromosome segregation ATPase
MSNLEIALTVLSILLTLGGSYMALRLKPLEDTDESLSERISGLHDDLKEDRDKFERRIADIERSYLSRADLTAAIKDLRDNMDKGVDRVEQVIRALGVKVDHLADRVGKVEAAP